MHTPAYRDHPPVACATLKVAGQTAEQTQLEESEKGAESQTEQDAKFQVKLHVALRIRACAVVSRVPEAARAVRAPCCR